jgi:tetratricopeptide (TPR) repeat protein
MRRLALTAFGFSLCIIATLTTATALSGSSALLIGYVLPANPELAADAKELESHCLERRVVTNQSCTISGNNSCKQQAEIAFRTCIAGIQGAYFAVYVCSKFPDPCSPSDGYWTVAGLNATEAVNSSINSEYDQIPNSGTSAALGLSVSVDSAACRITNTSGTEVDFGFQRYLKDEICAGVYEKAADRIIGAKDYDAALELYNLAIATTAALSPGYPDRGIPGQPAMAAVEQLGTGNLLLDKSDKRGAISRYTQAIAIDPTYTWPYVNRGIVYASANSCKNALPDFDKAIDLGFNGGLVFLWRGTCLYKTGEYDGAIANINKALSLEPGNASRAKLYDLRGQAYAAKLMYDQAISDYSSAITFFPKYEDALINRAIAYGNKDAFGSAVEDLNQAIQLNPRDAAAYNDRCWVRVLANQNVTKALADCSRSLELAPKAASALDSIGFANLRAGNNVAAIRDFNAALAVDPKIPTSLFGRGLAKQKTGDEKGARADFTAAIALRADIESYLARYGFTPKSSQH